MIAAILTALCLAQSPSTTEPGQAERNVALAAVVRIENPATRSTGSGFLLGQSGPFLYLLTASHVIDGAGGWVVVTYQADTPPKADKTYRNPQVLDRLEAEDVALVRVPAAAAPTAALKLVRPDAKLGKSFAVVTVGCGGGNPPSALAGRVTGAKLVRRAGESDVVKFWELDQTVAAGRSGGPVIGPDGRALGVLSLTTAGHGYAAHADAIHALLRRNGLSDLGE